MILRKLVQWLRGPKLECGYRKGCHRPATFRDDSGEGMPLYCDAHWDIRQLETRLRALELRVKEICKTSDGEDVN